MDSPQAVFIKRFGDLVALLRVDPSNDAAQELALAAATGAVADEGVTFDAGIERSLAGEELSLQSRLRARGVDTVRVAAGAEAHELLMLARALSHDFTPVPTTPAVAVEFVSALVLHAPGVASSSLMSYAPARGDGERRLWTERRRFTAERWRGPERRRSADRRTAGERRVRVVKHQEQEIAQLAQGLAEAVRVADWSEALNLADRMRAYVPRVPAVKRRALGLSVRRHLSRPALESFVELALHDPALQLPATGILRWAGMDGAEAMLAAVCSNEAVGARQFLVDALGSMPDAFPVVAPLLGSRFWFEVRHAATILGRQQRPEAIEPLKRHLDHPDARVRAAVLRALAAFPASAVADAFRRALAHSSPDTRIDAAAAIGLQGAPAFAMPLAAGLARERNAAVWSAMARALGAIGSPDACAALTVVALERRLFLRRRGYSTPQRIDAVRVLAAVPSPAAAAALERIAREGDAPVRSAALAATDNRAPASRRVSGSYF